MRQRGYGRDPELTFRMFFTMFMLGLVYIAFIGLLLFAGVDFIFIAFIAVAMALFQYFGSDRLVLAATRAKVVSPQEEPHLHATIERLAAMADIPKPKKIAVMDTHVPNAFATGRNPKNAVVAVTRGLMSRLSEREVEAVLALFAGRRRGRRIRKESALRSFRERSGLRAPRALRRERRAASV